MKWWMNESIISKSFKSEKSKIYKQLCVLKAGVDSWSAACVSRG